MTLEIIIPFIALGALGGLARALVGLVKSNKKGGKFRPWYFSLSLFTGLITGAIAGSFTTELSLAIVAGYAGSDIIENIYKTMIAK